MHLAASGEDPRRADHLCNIAPAEYRARFRALLPARLSGREFLDRWGDTGDAATEVDPDQVYPVRGATEHPINENARVRRFIAALGSAARAAGGAPGGTDHARADGADSAPAHTGQAMAGAGRLMHGSHRSYSRNCGLGAPETDLLVSLVRASGPEWGLLGAKITGGGSGGTVAVLLRSGEDGAARPARAALDAVRDAYTRRTGRPCRLIDGSLPGAAALAPVVVRW